MRSNKCNVDSYGAHKIESLGKCQIKCMISPECIDNVEFLILKPSQLHHKCKNIIPIVGLEPCVKYDLIKRVDMICSEKELFIKKWVYNQMQLYVQLEHMLTIITLLTFYMSHCRKVTIPQAYIYSHASNNTFH